MIQNIVKDENFLRLPSIAATKADLYVAQDLQDTLAANADKCVGLAANMINVAKRIIAVDDDGTILILFNPEIIKCNKPFDTREACLSLEGTRPCKRYKNIKVQYQNSDFDVRIKTFRGFTAQIIQHEIDHLNGIII